MAIQGSPNQVVKIATLFEGIQSHQLKKLLYINLSLQEIGDQWIPDFIAEKKSAAIFAKKNQPKALWR